MSIVAMLFLKFVAEVILIIKAHIRSILIIPCSYVTILLYLWGDIFIV